MDHLASDVCHGREEAGRDLALNASVPTVLLHRPQVRRHRQIRSIRSELRVLFVVEKWIRISAGIIRPRIVETDSTTNDRETEWRNRRFILNEDLRNKILGD